MAVGGGFVKGLTLDAVGQVVRTGEAVGRVRVVLVALTVAELLHESGGSVEDVGRRYERAGLAGQAHRPAVAAVDGDGLGRGGQVDDRLSDRELPLRRPQALVGVPGRQRHLEGGRVGHADILAGKSHQTARHVERVLAPAQHARQPVQSGVRIGAAHRLVQGRDEVVVLLAGLVVQGSPGGDDTAQPFNVKWFRAACVLGGEDLLNHAQQVAAVAVGHGQQGGAGILSQGEAATRQGLGARQQLGQGGLVQAAQDHDLAARQEGAVELEARVLGGRTDQDDCSVLNIGQEGVLLGAVETVDLVDEQERALPDLAAAGRGGEDLAQVGHPGEGRRDLFEDQAGAVGQEPGDRRLAAARRAPQDDR